MKRSLQTALAAAALVAAGHAAAQITMYEGEAFRGRAITLNDRVWNLERQGFNDRASSIVIDHGRWEVCEHARFEGRCVVLRRGEYPSLREIGLNNQISSVRPVDPGRRYGNEYNGPPAVAVVPPQPQPPVYAPQPPVYAPQPVMPPPQQGYDWRRRPDEAVYQVPVTSARAVVGPPNQRCWIERQQVAQPYRNPDPNLGGAIIGGIVGGILGHQVGGGSGRDVATGIGAVAGAAIGSNVAGGNVGVATQNVQRCENVTNAQPDYWDVTYNYRGVEHRVQMATAPGSTILVNSNGEPRVQ